MSSFVVGLFGALIGFCAVAVGLRYNLSPAYTIIIAVTLSGICGYTCGRYIKPKASSK